MYIMITDKCNMSCEHCAFACTKEGSFMDFNTFKDAVAMDDYVTIGGGEPTLHPQFEKFLLYALGKCESTFIVTNGTNKELSLTMLEISNGLEEKFGVEMSQDEYHDWDMVDQKVRDSFNEAKRVRDVGDKISYTGRAKEYWNESSCQKHCVCNDNIVLPNGSIKFCGCDNAPIVGDTWNGFYCDYDTDVISECDHCWSEYLKTVKEEAKELVIA